MRTTHAVAVAAIGLSTLASAQSGGERALLLVDPTHDDALHVANVYAAARALPSHNVLFLDPDAPDYAALAAGPLVGMLGELRQRDRDPSVDFVILAPSDQYRVSAAGLVSDSCFPVHHFGLSTAYGLYDHAAFLLGPNLPNASTIDNPYGGADWEARSFRGVDWWRNGSVSTSTTTGAYRLLIPARLGWTGERGNTPAEVVDMIVRSVAADGTSPAGTVYYMQTTDFARSGPRHGTFPGAVAAMAAGGGVGEHLMDVLPTGRHDALGVMTGWASPNIDTADFTLLDGAFCDHLTSFAGHFGTSSQVKMSRWIAKGASGTSGTVEEPCNYHQKFAHARVHTGYRRGATLGEAWMRSMASVPLQTMFLGDPLTQPWPAGPTVDVPDAPVGPVAGVVALTPTGTPNPVTQAAVAAYELFVDGRLVDRVPAGQPFALDTSDLAAGPHALLVRAEDATAARLSGTWSGALDVAGGVAVALSSALTSGDLGTTFVVDVSATGADVEEVVVRQLGRVVAATPLGQDSVELSGRVLGAGPVRLVAEAMFAGGARAVSAPLVLDVSTGAGAPALAPPVVYGYRRELRALEPFVLDLPASFTDPLASASWSVQLAPAQATVVTASGPGLVVVPGPTAHGVDLVRFQVATPSGVSQSATIQVVYPSGADDVRVFCRSLPNSRGTGARLGWTGSASLAADDLTLAAAGLPTQAFAVVFRGQGLGQSMVGNGTLCVLGTQVRLDVVQADVGGDLFWPVLQSAQPGTQAVAGSTWGFQLWHRDSIGALSSFSDGLLVTFAP